MEEPLLIMAEDDKGASVDAAQSDEGGGSAASESGEDVPKFNIGDIVSLRSNPSTIFPIIEVMSGAGERRYRVFENNTRRSTYYNWQ